MSKDVDPEFWEYDRDGLIGEIKRTRDQLEDLRGDYAKASAEAGGLHAAIKEWATAESLPWDTIRRAKAERNLLQVYHRSQDDWLKIFVVAGEVVESWKAEAFRQQELGNDWEGHLIDAREMMTRAADVTKSAAECIQRGNDRADNLLVSETPIVKALRESCNEMTQWLAIQQAEREVYCHEKKNSCSSLRLRQELQASQAEGKRLGSGCLRDPRVAGMVPTLRMAGGGGGLQALLEDPGTKGQGCMKPKKPVQKSRNQLADETHTWIQERRHLWEFCQICGTVRRADRRNKPCKGPIKITMRAL